MISFRSMTLTLRPGLYFHQFEDQFLFFDLPHDRYFMLSGNRARSFDRFAAGEALAEDIEALQATGVITTAHAAACEDGCPPCPATESLLDDPLPRGGFYSTIASLAAQISARRDLRRHGLARVVAGLRSSQPATAPADPAIYADIAAAFVRAGRHLPAADQCLVRGIAMKRLVLARGGEARLVFGVTMPFAAHCWVQVGETVLTDPLDLVRHYQPIYAV